MENKIRCPRCGKEEVWKVGTPRGEQQYKCKNCRRKFITELNYSEEFKREAIQIFYEGNSGRAVGRIKGINKSTVYNWIKNLNEKTQKTDIVKKGDKICESKIVEEIDELFFYIKDKKQSIRNNIGNEKSTTNSRL